MNLCVVGAGYVGLTLSTVLASLGHFIYCIDKDFHKITALQNNEIPFFEPDLEDLLIKSRKNIKFTTNLSVGVEHSSALFITVGTPSLPDGSADITAIHSVFNELNTIITEHKTIIMKSTVPPGTCEELKSKLTLPNELFTIASNPEFLREGHAVFDMYNPDKTIIGISSKDKTTVPLLQQIYHSIKTPYIITNLTGAELIKYANNYFLATKISFINEFARICDTFDVEIKDISKAIGLDPRIGKEFLQAGLGYGGSCFPKDLKALQSISIKNNIDTPILHSVQEVNATQVKFYINKLKNLLIDLKDKKITILGLSFKPNTDDIRNSKSLSLIDELLLSQSNIHLYDPISNLPSSYQSIVTQHTSLEKAIENSECLILSTDWQMFKSLKWEKIKSQMNGNIIVDGRNFWNKSLIESYGFTYIGVGRP